MLVIDRTEVEGFCSSYEEFNKYLDILKEMQVIIYSTSVNMQVNGYIKFSVTLSPLKRSFDF